MHHSSAGIRLQALPRRHQNTSKQRTWTPVHVWYASCLYRSRTWRPECPVNKPIIIVVRLAAPFGDLWRQLENGLSTEIRVLTPGDLGAIPNATAVIIAAGGAEREAAEWLAGRDRPAGVPIYVAGLETGR